jgi:uncharacterized membrane protein YccC
VSTSQPASARSYGRGPSRLDPIAPDWLVRILAPKQAPVPWLDMARTALTVTGPLALGLALGQPGLAVFGGMGGMVGAFGDKGGTFGARFRRTAAGAMAALLGLLVGRAIQGSGAFAVVAVAGLAVVAALVSSISANLSFAGLQLLVYVAIAGGLPPGVPVPAVVGAFAVGVGWALLLSFVQSRLDPPVDAPRVAEAAVLRELAAALRGADGPAEGAGERPSLHEQRRQITRDLSSAYDDLVTARSVSPGRRADLRRLSATMTATFALVAATFDYLEDGGPRGTVLAPLLAETADLVAAGHRRRMTPAAGRLIERLAGEGAGGAAERPLTEALDQVLRSLSGRGADASLPQDAQASPAAWLVGRKGWTFAARLGSTLAVAEVVRQLVPLEKPYWILLTAALVLKPDLGSVFARGVQRTLGTLVGVVLGIAVVAVIPPDGWLLLLPVAALAFGFPFGASRNYGLLATFITPLVLLLLEFGVPVDTRLVLDRLLDTVIGAGVVLVVGYLCWPSTWRPRLGEHIATGVDALRGYAVVAFEPDTRPIGASRRRAYRAMSDIRSELQSSLAEPPPVSRQAAAWWPLIAQLENTVDDLSDASFLVRHHPDRRPPAEDVRQLLAGFDDLAAALRGHRAPRPIAAPTSPLLRDVAGDLSGARRIATGPLGAGEGERG